MNTYDFSGMATSEINYAMGKMFEMAMKGMEINQARYDALYAELITR